MSYEYREVKCPRCDHIFMWNKNSGEGILFHHYKLKSTGEPVEKAKCPQCRMEMIVLEHVIKGIDKEDDKIEIIAGQREYPPYSG